MLAASPLNKKRTKWSDICGFFLFNLFLFLSHLQSKKHANKVRLFYMLHPEDGGPPSKRLRPDNPVSSYKQRLLHISISHNCMPLLKRALLVLLYALAVEMAWFICFTTIAIAEVAFAFVVNCCTSTMKQTRYVCFCVWICYKCYEFRVPQRHLL